MSHHDMPPLYSSPQQPAAFPVPSYTELAQSTERVLHHAPEGATRIPSHGSREYRYKTDNLEVDLESSPWGLLYAAYGRNGTIKGEVKFIKRCNAILRVTAKFEGTASVMTSQHVAVSANKRTFVSHTITLFSTYPSATIAAGTVIPFTLSLPTCTQDGVTSLPPSSFMFHPGISAEVNYSLQIDIVRGTFHRHETRTIPILYLPKSSPELPPLLSIPLTLPEPTPGGLSQVQVSPVWHDNVRDRRVVPKDLACVQLFLPHPTIFAAGDCIPLALSIRCPSSPAIPKMLSQCISVFLVKQKKAWVNDGRQVSIREVVVGKVDRISTNNLQEGTTYMTMELPTGQHGSECSWGIDGIILVEYCIRVFVRPPTYARHLPVFRHDEVVQMRTDSYGTLERELLTMNGVPMPALGLSSLSTTTFLSSGTRHRQTEDLIDSL